MVVKTGPWAAIGGDLLSGREILLTLEEPTNEDELEENEWIIQMEDGENVERRLYY